MDWALIHSDINTLNWVEKRVSSPRRERVLQDKRGPLGAQSLCHNRSEHLPQINFDIIIALVNNYIKQTDER